ncbi:MAG: hypothetical protein H6625_07340 [Bdellovibrionaceae bacterium]|nr:hypothetical protein [Pseudobdellovibrionaceae bacterium]
MHTDDKKEQFVVLRAEGFSFDKIAAQLKVSKPTLIEWSRQLARDIRNLKATKVDALREQFLVTKEEKLKRLRSTLAKINDEIDKRDFSDVPTVKLLELEGQLMADYNKQFIFSKLW